MEATRTGDADATIDVRDEDTPAIGAALVPHRLQLPDSPEQAEAPTLPDVIDLELLDRLLGAQEEKGLAAAEAARSKGDLDALAEKHERTTNELEVERRERMISADRYREERSARAVADAKVAELRERVSREMATAEAEKEAVAEATARRLEAEREAARAVASMGWLARRRYRRDGNG